MPKLLKNSKKAIQTRNRVRMFRGIRSIIKNDSVSLVNVKDLEQKLKSNEESPPKERISSSNDRFLNLTDNLRSWAIEKNINKRAVTALLKILRSAGMYFLPQDSRTLLETPRKIEIIDLAGGKYWHNGLENCLTQVFSKLSSDLRVELNINVDGLPLFKNSPLVFWPILANVYGEFMSHIDFFALIIIKQLKTFVHIENCLLLNRMQDTMNFHFLPTRIS